MPTSGSSGCAIASSRARSISSPSTSCRTGRTFRSPASAAADHVDAIRQQRRREFPGKEIVIGEVGWPSAGRMREGALPSPANQARVIAGRAGARQAREFPRQRDRGVRPAVEARARRHRRRPLGPVRRRHAAPKFVWGEPVSNHPHWPWQAAGGVVLAALVFAAALARAARRRTRRARMARGRGECRGGRRADRLDDRERAGRKPRRRRLAALALRLPALALAAPLVGAAALRSVGRTRRLSPPCSAAAGPARAIRSR